MRSNVSRFRFTAPSRAFKITPFSRSSLRIMCLHSVSFQRFRNSLRDLILINGPLGAGKSVLAQGIGTGLGDYGPVLISDIFKKLQSRPHTIYGN